MKLIDYLKWVLANSLTKLWVDFRSQSKWSCSVPLFQKCWSILRRLDWTIQYSFDLVCFYFYQKIFYLLNMKVISFNSISDVDSKLPEKLKLKFVHIRPDQRYSALISILKYIVEEGSQTVVFVATQHHVELVSYVRTKTINFQVIRFIFEKEFIKIKTKLLDCRYWMKPKFQIRSSIRAWIHQPERSTQLVFDLTKCQC